MLKHLPLILGIALPVAFVGMVLGMAYLPALGVRPAYDFIYTNEIPNYQRIFKNEFRVEDGRLVLEPVDVSGEDISRRTLVEMPRLYRYNSETESVTEVSYEEVKNLPMSAGPSSPDGYLVEYRHSSSGLIGLFAGGDNNSGHYLIKGGAAKRIPAVSGNPYRTPLEVVGWTPN